MISRRSSVLLGLCLPCTFFFSPAAHAQDAYPSRPIRILVPYAAGGTTDQVARAVQGPMGEFLKQTIIIDNRPGAGGAIGTEMVAKAPADGYTLVFGNSGPSGLLPLMRKTPYDPVKDFRPVSTVAIAPLILAVPTANPAKTLKEFLVAAKRAGSSWNYGSVGVGSLSHLTGEYFNFMAGLSLTHIPYNGGAPMTTAFGTGQLQAAFVTGLDGQAMMQAGKLRYLAVASPERTAIVPGLPAIAEEVPGFKSVAWFGVLAPRGASDAVVAKLNEALVYAASRPEVVKMFSARNVEARACTPAEMDRMIRDEVAQWAPVIKRANIRLD